MAMTAPAPDEGADNLLWRAWFADADANGPLVALERELRGMHDVPIEGCDAAPTPEAMASVAAGFYCAQMHCVGGAINENTWPDLRPQRDANGASIGFADPRFVPPPPTSLPELVRELQHFPNGAQRGHQTGLTHTFMLHCATVARRLIDELLVWLDDYMPEGMGRDPAFLPGDLWGVPHHEMGVWGRMRGVLQMPPSWAYTREIRVARQQVADAEWAPKLHYVTARVDDLPLRVRIARLLDKPCANATPLHCASARAAAAWRLGACVLACCASSPDVKRDALRTLRWFAARCLEITEHIASLTDYLRELRDDRARERMLLVDWVGEHTENDGVRTALFGPLIHWSTANKLMQTCRLLRDVGRGMDRDTHLELVVQRASAGRSTDHNVWQPTAAQRLSGACMRVRKNALLHMCPRVVRDRGVLAPSDSVADPFVHLLRQSKYAKVRIANLKSAGYAVEYRLCRRMRDGSLLPLTGDVYAPCRNEACRRAQYCEQRKALMTASDVDGFFGTTDGRAKLERELGFHWEHCDRNQPEWDRAGGLPPPDLYELTCRPKPDAALDLPGCPPLTVWDPITSALKHSNVKPALKVQQCLLGDSKLIVGVLSSELNRRYPDPNGTDRMVIECRLSFASADLSECHWEGGHAGGGRFVADAEDATGTPFSTHVMIGRSRDFVCVGSHPDPVKAKAEDSQRQAANRARRGGRS